MSKIDYYICFFECFWWISHQIFGQAGALRNKFKQDAQVEKLALGQRERLKPRKNALYLMYY